MRRSLGAALLKAGQPAAAEKEFAAALEHARGDGQALYGLTQASKARGDTAAAEKAQAALDKAWQGDPAMLSLERL